MLTNQLAVKAVPTEWHKYEGNPTLNGSRNGFASVFYDSGVYHLYCSWGSVLHFTSSDGKTGWTADPLNPMLTGNNEGVPMVWKEGSVWYMLYRYGGPDKIGLANSTDASHWTRYEGNPVINVPGTYDPWGVIKVGSTYYLWINDGFGGNGRGAELATSTDLIHWTMDPNAIFAGGRYCVFPFKYGSYYYMLVPYYHAFPYSQIELYRCTSPTFYANQREYLGIVINPGSAGSWDQYRQDTPCVLTDTIYRDTYTSANNELWTYYASTPDSGGDWWTGMCIEQNITDALTRFNPPTTPLAFPTMSNETVVLDYNSSCWDGARGGPHNLDVLELNKDGHRYWGYYSTFSDDGIGLAFSDDLEHWVRYSTSAPLIYGSSWPTVGVQNGTIHLFHTKGSPGIQSIWRAASPISDGYNFTDVEIVEQNSDNPHDPFLWQNPVDNEWWLLWKEGWGTILGRHASNMTDLGSAPRMVLRTETDSSYKTLASPSIFYWNNTYYLTDESHPDTYTTRAFHSSVLGEGCFNGACECSNSPILTDNDPGGFSHVQDSILYFFYSHMVASGQWEMRMQKANLPLRLSFPELENEMLILEYNSSCWEASHGGPHNFDVLEVNKDGYRYWGYYGTANHDAVGLAFSNDLEHWVRYSTTTPIISGVGWPTVGLQNGTIHMFYIKNYPNIQTIYRATSPASDGYTFTEVEIVEQNSDNPHDPFLWQNPVDNEWWLLWKEGWGTILGSHAKNIEDIGSAPNLILRTETDSSYKTLASPGIFYWNNTYYLMDESHPDLWITRAFYSSVLEDGCFNGACECSNSPILPDDEACGFPHVQGNMLYCFYSHRTNDQQWDVRMKKANLAPASATKLYINPSSVDKTLADTGTTFDVNVTVENIADLFGFDFNLTWDRTAIALVNVDFESGLDAIWGSGNWLLIKNQSNLGWYKLVALSTTYGFNTSGTQALTRLTFLVQNTYGRDTETPIHFEIAKLSDSFGHPIATEETDGNYMMRGVKPTLQLKPTDILCRTYNESFTLTVNVTNIYGATDFEFGLRYNATLLKYVNVTFVSWHSGSMIVDDVNGNLTGYTAGDPLTGNVTILTLTFQTNYYHIWKTLPNWVNNLTSTIFFQWANLSYPSGPDLAYARGGLNQINIGTDVNYGFSPIQGDVDNNGIVDIFDLRTVAIYYDLINMEYNLVGEDVVDIFDLTIVASNFNFRYTP